jgi:hypothetical protein
MEEYKKLHDMVKGYLNVLKLCVLPFLEDEAWIDVHLKTRELEDIVFDESDADESVFAECIERIEDVLDANYHGDMEKYLLQITFIENKMRSQLDKMKADAINRRNNDAIMTRRNTDAN